MVPTRPADRSPTGAYDRPTMATVAATPRPAPPPAAPGLWWHLLIPLVCVAAGLIAALVVALTAARVVSGDLADVVGATAGSAAILACALACVRDLPRHERRRIFAAKASFASTLATGIGIGIVLVVVAAGIVAIGVRIEPGLRGRTDGLISPLGPGAAGVLLTILAVIVLAPLGEELAFRGIMLRGLALRMPFWGAAVISAGIFAGCHVDVWTTLLWPRYLELAVSGVVLAALNRSHGYWCGVTAHATVNTVAVLALALGH